MGISLFAFIRILFCFSFSFAQSNTHYDPMIVSSQKTHNLRLLNEGTVAFNQILSTISFAKKTIDLEYFIFKTDVAGKLIVHELIKSAKKGVKIRVLLDHSSFFIKLNDLFAIRLKNYGIEIKYFNRSTPITPDDFLWRNHRKLIVADGSIAILGGRNIGDEYFDHGTGYNFLDRDLVIEGPIVTEIRKSFDIFWNSPFATRPNDRWYLNENVNGWSRLRAIHLKIDEFFQMDKASLARLKTHRLIGLPILSKTPSYQCKEVLFATDSPNIPKKTKVHNIFRKLLQKTTNELIIETPYLILKDDISNDILDYLKRDGHLSILTNGLYSTDIGITYAALLKRIREPIKKGAQIYVYGGSPPKQPIVSTSAQNGIWGIHAKTIVFDRRHTMIGTFNIDPRSESYNMELTLVCLNNEDLANDTIKDIHERIKYSGQLDEEGHPLDHRYPYSKTPFYIRAGLLIFSPFVRYFDDYL